MLPLVTDGLVLGALLWAGLLMWRFPVAVSLGVLFAVVILDCINVLDDGINVGIFIHSDDVACVALLCAAAILIGRHREIFAGYLCTPALILLGLGMVNFLRGLMSYGAKPAGNGIRNLVYLVAPFLSISVIARAKKLSIVQTAGFLSAASLVFTAVAVLRWGGFLPTLELYEDFRQISRVLAADYPMIIGQALIVLVGLQLGRGVKPWPMLASLLFGIMVIVSQHRSVWLATAVGLLWLTFRSLRVASPGQILQFCGCVAGAAVIAVVLLVASGHAEFFTTMLKANVAETKRDDSTLAWRIDGYYEALQRLFASGVSEMVVGPPSGRDLDDVASIASVHIHNRYVDAFVFYGVLGFVSLLVWLRMLAARIWPARKHASPRTSESGLRLPLEGLLLSQLAYFMAYAGNMLSGVVLGMLWAVSTAGPELARRFDNAPPVDSYIGDRAEYLTAQST